MGCCGSKSAEYSPPVVITRDGTAQPMSNTWAYNRNTVRQKDNVSAFDREYERNEGEKPDRQWLNENKDFIFEH